MPTDFERIKDPARREHYVYTLLGPRGRIIYIGCSMNLTLRLKEHRRNALWGHLWTRVKARGPYNYQTARRLEREAIEAAQPPFNIEWTKGHRRGVAGPRLRGSA